MSPILTSMVVALTLTGCGSGNEIKSLVEGHAAHAEVTSDIPDNFSGENNNQTMKGVLEKDKEEIQSNNSVSDVDDDSIFNLPNSSQTSSGFLNVDFNTPDTVEERVQEVLEGTKEVISTANTLAYAKKNHKKVPIKDRLKDNVSQQFLGINDIEQRLIEALPEIEYTHSQFSIGEFAHQVNQADWTINQRLDPATVIKIQALLNWHNHGVGAVDGKFSRNTIKAMQTFQKARGIKPTKTMTAMTWNLLTADQALNSRPVLVRYTLTKNDVTLMGQWGGRKNTQYKSVREQLGEKFHMSRALLYRLNPNVKFKSGNTITVYNPGQPNTRPVHRVEVYKKKNLLVAYDENDHIVASYPTTIGVKSPSGTHYVANRVINPSYNSDFSNRAATLPPGPNNPVGRVWMGLSKPSFGIHGSPQPEMISLQRSHGCVRLTNWDALALYGTMQHRARVDFKNS